jgi:hypothetical protein
MTTWQVTRKYDGKMDKRIDDNGVHRSETGTWRERRTLFVDMTPMIDGREVNDVIRELALRIKKPFLGLFGGTREVVFERSEAIEDPDPLFHLIMTMSVIRTLRAEGYKVKTRLNAEHYDLDDAARRWEKKFGSNYLFSSSDLEIITRLKSAGLDELVIRLKSEGRQLTGHGWGYSIIDACLEARMNTYFHLTLDPGEWERRREIEFRTLEVLPSNPRRVLKLKQSHVIMHKDVPPVA